MKLSASASLAAVPFVPNCGRPMLLSIPEQIIGRLFEIRR